MNGNLHTNVNRYHPNIVMVVTDDQGPWAVPWNMPELHMPNLARWAEEGFRFNEFYCASPVCSPARASLLTGRMPSAHGVHDWLVGTRHPQAYPDVFLENLLTLPQILAGAGYECAMSGKWHVGDSRRPAAGFTHWYAHRYGGSTYYDAPIWSQDGEEANEDRYFTYAVSDHAVEFIERHDTTKPLFMWVATTAPHDPWVDGNHPQELLEIYEGEDFPSVPREERHPWTAQRKEDFDYAFKEPTAPLRGYCASLSGVDKLLGNLEDALKAKGIYDDTILFYVADNGFSCGHHGIWGKGNGTFPMNFWENSVKVPAVLRIPPRVCVKLGIEDTGRTVNHPVSGVDVLPTLCQLAGVSLPVDDKRAGQSFVRLLDKPDADLEGFDYFGDEASCRGEGRPLFDEFTHPVVVFDEYGGGRMVRTRTWKLVLRHDGPTELFNMREDPDERDNLAAQVEINETYREIFKKLSEVLNNWFAEHQTDEYYAYDRPVTGWGQVLPAWRGTGQDAFVQSGNNYDGVER